MKICKKCGLEKPSSGFNKKTKGTLQPYCKICQSQYSKEWHNKNKTSRLPRLQSQKKVRVEAARNFLKNYLVNKSCKDCHEDDFVVLEFDHKHSKRYVISEMVGNGYSIDAILKEIEKCDIVCSNCHTRRTAKQLGWWKIL